MSDSFSISDDSTLPRKPYAKLKKNSTKYANNAIFFDEKIDDSISNLIPPLKIAKGKKLSHEFHNFCKRQKNIENKLSKNQTVKESNSYRLSIEDIYSPRSKYSKVEGIKKISNKIKKKNVKDSPNCDNKYDDFIKLKQDSDIRSTNHKKNLPNKNLNENKNVNEFKFSFMREEEEKTSNHGVKRILCEEDNNFMIKGKNKLKILVVDDHVMVRDSTKKLVDKCLRNLNLIGRYEVVEGIDGVDILYSIINDQTYENLIKCVITDENIEYINGSESIMIDSEKFGEIERDQISQSCFNNCFRR